MSTQCDDTTRSNGSLVWQLVDKLDEQRHYPRVPVAVPLTARNYRGESVATMAMNMSPDGLQLRCDVATAKILHPNGGHVRPQSDAPLTLCLELPAGDGTAALEVSAQLLYLTSVDSAPRCVIGMLFVELAAEARQRITSYVCEQMAGDEASALN